MIEGHDIGGTCVNRGCVPSKALLAASGRVREMKNQAHLKAMGVQVGSQAGRALVGRSQKHLRMAQQMRTLRMPVGQKTKQAPCGRRTFSANSCPVADAAQCNAHWAHCCTAMHGWLAVQVGAVSFDRQGIADHATNLAKTVQSNLKRSLEALGVVSRRAGRHACTQTRSS